MAIALASKYRTAAAARPLLGQIGHVHTGDAVVLLAVVEPELLVFGGSFIVEQFFLSRWLGQCVVGEFIVDAYFFRRLSSNLLLLMHLSAHGQNFLGNI